MESNHRNSSFQGVLGPGKSFAENQLPTIRSVIQRAILEKETLIADKNIHFSQVILSVYNIILRILLM